MTIEMMGPGDGDFIEDAIAEVATAFEEPITIRRWTGNSGGSAAQGVAATDAYTDIRTTAVISELTAKEINYPGSIFSQGDLKIECQQEIKGLESYTGDQAAAAKKSDLVVYRGRTYRVIGTVNREFLNSTTHFAATMRRQG